MPKRALRLLVCGSRNWTDMDAIYDVLADYRTPRPVIVLHGGARGADSLADDAARLHGYAREVYKADWKKHGKRAGILRNLRMLDAYADKVIAFHDGQSRGTQHTIDEARKRGIPVEVHSDEP